jgi:hypothetical protein
MDKIVPSMTNALFDSDLVATRLALALAEFLWFVMLMWPGNTMSRPTYSIMGQALPEACWAGIFAVTSALQFSIVLYEQYNAHWARLFACWNAALWVFCVGSMLLSVYPPPAAIGGEISLAVAAVWIWVRPLLIMRGERHVGL